MKCSVCGEKMKYGAIGFCGRGTTGITWCDGEQADAPFGKKPFLKWNRVIELNYYFLPSRYTAPRGYYCPRCGAVLMLPEKEEIIAACGNNCAVCPRHIPKSDRSLERTARMWRKIGYRDYTASAEEMECGGCTKENFCRYKIAECVFDRGYKTCADCGEYPCERIRSAFKRTIDYEPRIKAVCTENDDEILHKAFFEKEKNLNELKRQRELEENDPDKEDVPKK